MDGQLPRELAKTPTIESYYSIINLKTKLNYSDLILKINQAKLAAFILLQQSSNSYSIVSSVYSLYAFSSYN